MPPQPSAVMAAMFVLGAAVVAVLTLGPLVWFLVLWRRSRGEPGRAHEPRREASWGLIDLVVAFVLMIVFTITGAMLAQWISGVTLLGAGKANGNEARLYLMFVGAAAQILAAAATAAFIAIRTGCSLRDLGFSLSDLGRDLQLGGAAFCALAIPTYGLQLILVQFWKSAHPLIESLKVDPDPQFLAIAIFAAVISAPLSEEFAFRVLFQGWLEKMFHPLAARRPGFGMSLLIGERAASDVILAEVVERASEIVTPGPALQENPYLSPITPPVAESAFISNQFNDSNAVQLPAWVGDVMPIAISSAIFAVLHYTHGPDWIPLFGLALGLGYLYRRTHRITPGLVVHFLLNLVSMIALCVEIYQVKPK